MKKHPFLKSISVSILEHSVFTLALRKHFDENADAIYCSGLMRLMHQTPLKNMNVHLQENFLSESFPEVSLADKKVSSLLKSIGSDRERINAFFREFSCAGENILMDITAIHTKSEQMSINQRGYNAQGSFDPQANFLLLFSQSRHEPVYYRVLPGNIRDVKSVQLTLNLETAVRDAKLAQDLELESLCSGAGHSWSLD